jgi:hypothetical protein
LGGIPPALQTVLDDCATWIQSGDPQEAPALHARIAALAHEPMRSWDAILRQCLVVRLTELVSIVRHSRTIRRHVVDGAPAPAETPMEMDFVATSHQVRDHGLAILSALAAGLALLLVCGFWIETSWTAGAGAAVIVAVACSFFAAQDDPAPAIALMLRNAVIVTVAAGIYEFAILPRVETFFELALVLASAAMVIGVLVSRPATFGTGMVMGAFGSTDLALGNGYGADFALYVNNAVGLVAGVSAALVITRLKDIAAAADNHETRENRAHLTGIMLDRLGLLMPRLAAVSPGADIAAADVLLDLRVGLNVLGLQHALDDLPGTARRNAAAVLTGIAAHYRGNPLQSPPPVLLTRIDATIRAVARDTRPHGQALMLLVGLRSILFADAPPPEVAAWDNAPPFEMAAE